MVELLNTKLFIPPLRPDLVPRLIQLLHEGLRTKPHPGNKQFE